MNAVDDQPKFWVVILSALSCLPLKSLADVFTQLATCFPEALQALLTAGFQGEKHLVPDPRKCPNASEQWVLSEARVLR